MLKRDIVVNDISSHVRKKKKCDICFNLKTEQNDRNELKL